MAVTVVIPDRPRHGDRRALLALLVVVVLVGVLVAAAARMTGGGPIKVGAVFPLTGDSGAVALASQERLGVQIAADFVNADGGVAGRSIQLDVRNLPDATSAQTAIAAIKADGAAAVIGAYSSDLSMAASSAANAAGLVYWESGAVADRLTGRGLPLVFRVGADGSRLGTNSAQFTATELAPRLALAPANVRVTVVAAQDPYASSVADAAVAETRALGMDLTRRIDYNLSLPRWSQVMSALAASRPDVVILASHIPDGVAFVQALHAADIKVDALIGTTMAECVPDFGNALGDAALGIFGSDRPPGGFNPGVLDAGARALYERFAAAWARDAGGAPTEEGLSGFTAAWALFHDVLPAAAGHGPLDASGIAAAARAVDLPGGSLPNGAGLRFASDAAHLGQNLRAAAVMWQWQPASSANDSWGSSSGYGAYGSAPTASTSSGSGATSGYGGGSWATPAPTDPPVSAAGAAAAASSPVRDIVVWPATFAWGAIQMVPLP